MSPVKNMVLVVDDHPDMREVVSILLEYHGFLVRVARNGEEAVRIARAWIPDVILMDLAMPRMDGFSAMRELSTGGPALIPVIAVTAREVQRADLEPYGFRGLLRKPVDMDTLLSAVADCLDEGHITHGQWIGSS